MTSSATDHDLDIDPKLEPYSPDQVQRGTSWKTAYWRASSWCLQNLATLAGSTWTFALNFCIIIGWAIAGIFLHGSDIWQIGMQNASSVQCYLWDITLLFVQRNDHEELSSQLSLLQARAAVRARLLPTLVSDSAAAAGKVHKASSTCTDYSKASGPSALSSQDVALPARSWYDGAADWASHAAGSPWTQMIFAGGIIAWLALGPSLQFGDQWQLYVNTATAVELSIMITFLQNTKRRHRRYMHLCSQQIAALDEDLHERLFLAAGKPEEATVTAAVIKPAEVQPGCWAALQRGFAISVERYAVFMGSIGNITLSILLLGLWLGLGKVLGYGNSNWWLMLGTYTGLVGFIDAFVLRNMLKLQNTALLAQCDELDRTDNELLASLSLPSVPQPQMPQGNIFYKISTLLSKLAATTGAVLASVLVVIALLIVASTMHWSQTAQLLCNTPTMIIEGAMLLSLMMAHMASHEYMRARLQAMLLRQVILQGAFDRLGIWHPTALAIPVK